ncbi:MAG: hypothetical protein R3261_02255, partial [Alphaproteobacteria bacterium]|nr:hypothetical protein [Alphaproteobacteria bacterium]
ALRNELLGQWRKLKMLRRHSPLVKKFLTGIDAAANELHTPPEVFAPLYRYCRHEGVKNFTYHAGEDFVTLSGGIRAVYEAATFLKLRNGDRIGHGTAIGIDPKLWLKRSPKVLYVKRGDYIDDLVFAYFLLSGKPKFLDVVQKISSKLNEQIPYLYPKAALNLDNFVKAWKLRELDARLLLPSSLRDAETSLIKEEEKEASRFKDEREKNALAFELFAQYHSSETIAAGQQIIDVKTKLIPEKALKYMQQRCMKLLREREIVLEVPVTSNLRISLYESHEEHHLFRWLRNTPKEPRMNVVLGSDDPGIFATNVQNDLEHIHRVLEAKSGKHGFETRKEITRLLQNGNIYRFRSEEVINSPDF